MTAPTQPPADGLTAEEVDLALILRRAARAYLRLSDGDYWPSDVADAQAKALAPVVAAIAEERAEARLAAAWPCDNYRSPLTCLTAPSSETGRCDWCREAVAAVVRDVLTASKEALLEAEIYDLNIHQANADAIRAVLARHGQGGES